jgi:hypothetical protein
MNLTNLMEWIFYSTVSGAITLGIPWLLCMGPFGLIFSIIFAPAGACYGLIMGTVQGTLLQKLMIDNKHIACSAAKSTILGLLLNLIPPMLISSVKYFNSPNFVFINLQIDTVAIFAISGMISGFCMGSISLSEFQQKRLNAFVLAIAGLFAGSILGDQLFQINDHLSRTPL